MKQSVTLQRLIKYKTQTNKNKLNQLNLKTLCKT